MTQSDAYGRLRTEFVELCVRMAPGRFEPERRQNAPGEFDAFCGDVRIVRVAVSSDGFLFVTTPLVMDGDFGPLWAGAYAVKILLSDRTVQCCSLMRKDSQTQHPHVSGFFQACLGSNAAAVTKFRGDGKIAHLAIFIVEFLEKYNSRYAIHWSLEDWAPLTEEEVERWKRGR